MQKIIPKRSVGGATQQQPSRTIGPLTQLPLFHHQAVTRFQTWYLSKHYDRINIRKHRQNPPDTITSHGLRSALNSNCTHQNDMLSISL